jgi:predicted AlkP superfamily phosphohydrolase/phosphomutase
VSELSRDNGANGAENSASRSGRSTRTLVIGLSGCSWNLLEPLLETGAVPFLASLIENGSSATLESSLPYHTGAAWASFATGSSPGRHGMHDTLLPAPKRGFRYLHAQDLRRPTYYQQLGREGKRSVFVNLPLDQNGCEGAVIVNSRLTTDDARRLFPLGRRDRYRRLLEAYRVAPRDFENLDDFCAVEQARFDLTRELYLREDWDHFFVCFSASDWVANLATGSALNGDEDARSAFRRVYRQLDGYVRWLVEHSGDAVTFVLSEYGRTEELAVLRVNSVLNRLGLVTKAEPGWNGVRPTFPAGRRLRRTLVVPAAVGRHAAGPVTRNAGNIAKAAARQWFGVQLMAPSYEVDFGTSRAFMPADSASAVFVREPDDSLVEKIAAALLEPTLHDGSPAVRDVWTTEELWGRPALPDEPALIFDPAPGVRPSAAVRERELEPPMRGHGCHQREGVFLLSSGGATSTLGTVSICDLAPTILWAMGAAIPAGVDGRVLMEAFPREAAGRPIRNVEHMGADTDADPSLDEEGEATRRLKALGYI